jgi:hypothetical protein
VGVVTDQPICSNASHHAADRGGVARPALVILKARLEILIIRQGEPIAPACLIPVRLNDTARGDAMNRGEVLTVTGVEKAHTRLIDPSPSRVKDADREAFHHPRRHRDEEIADLAGLNSL